MFGNIFGKSKQGKHIVRKKRSHVGDPFRYKRKYRPDEKKLEAERQAVKPTLEKNLAEYKRRVKEFKSPSDAEAHSFLMFDTFDTGSQAYITDPEVIRLRKEEGDKFMKKYGHEWYYGYHA